MLDDGFLRHVFPAARVKEINDALAASQATVLAQQVVGTGGKGAEQGTGTAPTPTSTPVWSRCTTAVVRRARSGTTQLVTFVLVVFIAVKSVDPVKELFAPGEDVVRAGLLCRPAPHCTARWPASACSQCAAKRVWASGVFKPAPLPHIHTHAHDLLVRVLRCRPVAPLLRRLLFCQRAGGVWVHQPGEGHSAARLHARRRHPEEWVRGQAGDGLQQQRPTADVQGPQGALRAPRAWPGHLQDVPRVVRQLRACIAAGGRVAAARVQEPPGR